ncbi:MAG TPA: SpoIIE family protein phosphatase [Terriglobia bacterium]|nr:SpoIIE family protein phosphatase [Terriglobia bacterium]
MRPVSSFRRLYLQVSPISWRLYAVLSRANKRLRYCNAGHNPPILAPRNGADGLLSSGGGVLGVFPDWQYEDREVQLHPGDRMLM